MPLTWRDVFRFQSTPPVKAATSANNYDEFNVIFQSTPPVKAATSNRVEENISIGISIHAAREGGDKSPVCKWV